jgi:hypothetical protein
MIVLFLLGVGVAYLAWSLVAMEINYREASSMGIPLVRLPVDPMNIPWVIFEPFLWRLLDHLPFDFGTFGRFSRTGWHFQDKAKSHLKYGPTWALVTPRDIYVHVADPSAIHEIFSRRGDFLRPSKMYSKQFRVPSVVNHLNGHRDAGSLWTVYLDGKLDGVAAAQKGPCSAVQ